MQNYLKKQQIKACVLSLFELLAIICLFLVVRLEYIKNNDLIISALIALNALVVLVNFFFLIIVLVRISNSKQKSDIVTSDILGEEISEIYRFGKIGIVITDDNNKIIWTNDWLPNSQLELIDKDVFAWQKDLEKLINVDYANKANKERKNEPTCKVVINNSTYEVRCIKGPHVFLFKDITEVETVNKYASDHLPAIGVLMLDNYSDIAASSDDLSMNMKIAQIHNLIAEYSKEFNLYVKKFRADSYLIVCTNNSYRRMLADKFSIVQKIKNVENDDRQVITASIGFSVGVDDYIKLSEKANEALNFALSRGGDQSVIAAFGENFKFFGGTTEAKESNNSKVEMRSLSQSLETLIKNHEEIYIMGHTFADFDAIGSALGLYYFASHFDKKVKIIYNEDLVESKTKDAFKKLFTRPEISQLTVSPSDAFKLKRAKSLLILTDVHSYDLFMAPEVVEKASSVAIIDHHRRSEKAYENPAFSCAKPYASSASELVAEMLRYNNSRIEIPEKVATMMLAGIILDTNHYRNKTSQSTYDASLILKEYGANNDICDSFFKEDYNEFALRTKILATGISPAYGVQIYFYDGEPISKTVLAVVAQHGLTIKDVNATFVVGRIETNKVGVSARSDGTVNCQLLLEKMQGGGHFAAAATQLVDKSVDEVVEQLKEVLNQYLDEARAAPGSED